MKKYNVSYKVSVESSAHPGCRETRTLSREMELKGPGDAYGKLRELHGNDLKSVDKVEEIRHEEQPAADKAPAKSEE